MDAKLTRPTVLRHAQPGFDVMTTPLSVMSYPSALFQLSGIANSVFTLCARDGFRGKLDSGEVRCNAVMRLGNLAARLASEKQRWVRQRLVFPMLNGDSR